MNFADHVRGVTLRLIDLLEENSVPYALMGGIAVPVWGIPRATYDIDVMLSVTDRGLREFIGLAAAQEFQIEAAYEKGFRDVLEGMEKIRLEWWTPESRRVEVDVFLVTTPYQEAAFARRRRVRIDGRETWVLSAADLILHKRVDPRIWPTSRTFSPYRAFRTTSISGPGPAGSESRRGSRVRSRTRKFPSDPTTSWSSSSSPVSHHSHPPSPSHSSSSAVGAGQRLIPRGSIRNVSAYPYRHGGCDSQASGSIGVLSLPQSGKGRSGGAPLAN